MQMLVDIPDADIEMLGTMAAGLGISRDEFIRRAITMSLAPHRTADEVAAFGILKGKLSDGVAYQDKVRGEW